MAIDTTKDKLLKVAQNTGWQVGSGGVPDASTTTIPLVNTTNLPTDTAIIATIDRVDANGTATPSKMERVVARISGNNLVDCIRGFEGTAQAHVAGAVVEIVISAGIWNKVIDALKKEHNSDGTHTPYAIASAVYVEDTGADDAYEGTLNGLTSLIAGLNVRLKATTENTGACTFDLNGLGAKAIKKIGGSGLTDLNDGDIASGEIVDIVYDGTQWQLNDRRSTTYTNSPTSDVSIGTSWTTIVSRSVTLGRAGKIKVVANCSPHKLSTSGETNIRIKIDSSYSQTITQYHAGAGQPSAMSASFTKDKPVGTYTVSLEGFAQSGTSNSEFWTARTQIITEIS